MNHEEKLKEGLMLRPKDVLADRIIELTEYCNKETARADKEKGWGEAQGLLRNAAVKLKDKEIAAIKEQNAELLSALKAITAGVVDCEALDSCRDWDPLIQAAWDAMRKAGGTL